MQFASIGEGLPGDGGANTGAVFGSFSVLYVRTARI